MIMKKVSIYVKGDRTTPEYYRMYQYFDVIDDISCRYNCMMSTHFYKKYMPISKQPIYIKIWAFIHQFTRMNSAVIKDLFEKPDYIIIHKRILSRMSPFYFQFILKYLHNCGTKIYWDIDDNILETKEISMSMFCFLSELSDKIVVTHTGLRDMFSSDYHDKICILPTTDGDLYKYATDQEMQKKRLSSLNNEVRLVWIGTSFNLKYVQSLLPVLDDAAKDIQTQNRTLSLNVVCDKPIEYKTSYLKLTNTKWSRDMSVKCLQESHIGIMPLTDNKFNRGKGGFKLVQYLSIALPCIGSSVGFNNNVIDSSCGVLIPNGQLNMWKEAISKLSDKDDWNDYSKNAFIKWTKDFSFDKNLTFWKTNLGL